MSSILFTSESVTEGHPDKICDQVSDGVVDDALRQDKHSRVAIETAVKDGMIMCLGEMTTAGYINVAQIIRRTLKEIGYTSADYGIDHKSCAAMVNIAEQSPDIAQGVNAAVADGKVGSEQGAGDQGMMFGFACDETDVLMPLPIHLAHQLAMKLAEVRKAGGIDYLRPDGKTQVTIEYVNGVPKRVHTVVVSTQHNEGVAHNAIKSDVTTHIIKPVLGSLMDDNTIIWVNPTGKFVIGGPVGDSGVTGRKIIVDTYGGMGRHGGGAFSGKDPSKVDRSAAYAMRYIAKNLVASGVCSGCEVQVAYAIGVAEPVSLMIETFGTHNVAPEKLITVVRDLFPLKPADIINHFDLLRPIYQATACYGHFGRPGFPWESLDKVDQIRAALGL